jgi:outer membrane protein OmpA-like peptidoglycan-associated protein
MPAGYFRRLLSALALFMPAQALAAESAPQVFVRNTEKYIRGDAPVPLVLQLGTDLGYLSHSTTIPDEGPFNGSLLTGKAMASFLFPNWIAEAGLGWSYSALYGTTRSDNPAIPSIGHRIYTQSAFAEGGLRFRLTDKFNLGIIVQDYFGTDLTLSQRKDLVSHMLLGGGMMAVDLLSDSGIFRLGATVMAELPDNQRRVLLYGLTLQFGIPLRGYDILLRKTDVVVRSEKIQKVDVPKVVTRSVVREVSKFSLPRDLLRFTRGQATLTPEDQSFLLELAQLLKQYQDTYRTVAVEVTVKSSGEANRDKKISESRAQSIRNVLVSAGLNAQRTLATGLGGRTLNADRISGSGSATLVDLSFSGLTQPDQLNDALNNFVKRKATPETCRGEKCN